MQERDEPQARYLQLTTYSQLLGWVGELQAIHSSPAPCLHFLKQETNGLQDYTFITGLLFIFWEWHLLGQQGDQTSQSEWKSTIFIGRTEAEAEAPVLWPPDSKSWFAGKDPDAGKDWGQEKKGATEDEMVVWHHRLNKYEFQWTPGESERQESLACRSPWGCKELDTT